MRRGAGNRKKKKPMKGKAGPKMVQGPGAIGGHHPPRKKPARSEE